MLAGQDSGGQVYPDPNAPHVNPGGPMIPSAGQTPAAPAAPPPGTVTISPGYTPDYGGLIGSDPTYVAAQNAATAAQQSADAQRRAAIRSAYIKYGGKMPDGWTDVYGDLDQATRDAAAANQYSTVANLQNNYSQSVEQFKRALAARGMLQSGDLNYGQNQLDRGLGQGEYDAANAFTGDVNSALSAYSGVLGQNARDLASAIQGAESNVESNPAYRPTPAQTADYDATSSAKYGKAIYKGADGTLYTGDGGVFNPDAAAPTTPDAGGHSAAWMAYHYGPDWAA